MSRRDPRFSSPHSGAARATLPSSRPDDYLDLCTTCIHNGDCLGRATLIRPVHFCEEFDCHTANGDSVTPVSTPVAPVVGEPVPAEVEQSQGYTGICVNCDFRETCRNSRTEGGIWHCEEYA